MNTDSERQPSGDCSSSKLSADSSLSIAQLATTACLLEAIAPKPGNVHRGADFEDLTFTDFALSAVAIGPAMEAAAAGQSVGRSVLQGVSDTQTVVKTNTNLGIILLLVPLAAVPTELALEDGIKNILLGLDDQDAFDVYEAIRLADPGGLGSVDQMDIADQAPSDLIQAMQLAVDRDLVARQYTSRFHEVFQLVVPWIAEGVHNGWPLTENIVYTHVRLMSHFPDSLIQRKCGPEIAKQASDRAGGVIESGGPGDDAYHRSLADFDFWLRSDHHRRNPGTTADLITAGIFTALREKIIIAPYC